jgi:hypothetical protein
MGTFVLQLAAAGHGVKLGVGEFAGLHAKHGKPLAIIRGIAIHVCLLRFGG